MDLDGLLGALGVQPQGDGDPNTPPAGTDVPPATPPATEPPAAATEPLATEPPATPPEGDTPPATEPPATPPADKNAAAFAQMRIQNAQMQKMFKNVAELAGIEDTSDPDALMAKLNEKLVASQAQKQGVPAELLQRLNQLEQANQVFTQDQVRQTAYLGFQKVKDSFELTDAELSTFADTLVANGVNPFEQPVDLVAEYKIRNYDVLMQKAIDKGVQQEMARAQGAQQHSSTPNSTTGAKPGEQDGKINTVTGLNDWMKANTPK